MSRRAVCTDVASASTNYVFTSNTPTRTICGFGVPNGWKSLACQVSVTVNTPSNPAAFASTAVNTGTSTATVTGHGLITGTAVTMTTTGSLPTGLATSTTYYIIAVDVNTVAWASSLANAKAGTKITLSTQGSGNDTINVTALAGGALQLQKSIDGVTWYNEGSSQNVTVTGTFYFEKVDPATPYYSIQVTLTSGQLGITTQYFGAAEVQS